MNNNFDNSKWKSATLYTKNHRKYTKQQKNNNYKQNKTRKNIPKITTNAHQKHTSKHISQQLNNEQTNHKKNKKIKNSDERSPHSTGGWLWGYTL